MAAAAQPSIDLPATMQPLPNRVCPLCGAANQCAPATAGRLDVECWCTEASVSREALARVPRDLLNKACLCPHCTAGVHEAARDPPVLRSMHADIATPAVDAVVNAANTFRED